MKMPVGQTVLRVPPHYVQLAAALGLNSQNIAEVEAQTGTDFESLIEMHRKHANVTTIDIKDEIVPHSLYSNAMCPKQGPWESFQQQKSPSPVIGQDMTVMSLTAADPSSKIRHQHDVKVQHIPHSNANIMEVDIDDEKPMPKTKLYELYGKKAYVNRAYEEQSSKENRNYEQNQNNQNLMNQNCDLNVSNQGDESMWRPW